MQRYAAPANRPVVGLADAGVGAIAGPVFAAAVLLPTNWQPSMAAVDSKTLSLEARHAAFKAVCATPGLVWATAAVRARQVDTMGGHPATALAMEQAVAKLEAKPASERREGEEDALVTWLNAGRESVSKQVFRYCRLSAEKGYVPAMLMVGMAHREGQGVERDLDEATRWLERAAAKGNAQAIAALDEMNA